MQNNNNRRLTEEEIRKKRAIYLKKKERARKKRIRINGRKAYKKNRLENNIDNTPDKKYPESYKISGFEYGFRVSSAPSPI